MMTCFTHTYAGEPIPPKSPPYIPNFGTPCKNRQASSKGDSLYGHCMPNCHHDS